MVLRIVAGAMLALTIAAHPALACYGEEIYSDDFADANGPWGEAPWFKIASGYAEIKMDPGYRGVTHYMGSRFTEFDVCVDITYPASRNPDGGTYGGLVIWFQGMDNAYEIFSTPIGVLGVYRHMKGRSLLASAARKYDSIKAGTGARNTFRVTVKGSNITVYANDRRAISLKAVAPEGGGYIGLMASSEREQSNAWRFSNFKLTEIPK